MNKFIKVILCIAVGCIGAGCAALILGFALGGTLADVRHYAWLNRLENGIAENIGGIDIHIADEVQIVNDTDVSLTNFTADADEVNEISLHIYHGELAIIRSDSDKIRAYAEGNTEGVAISCAGGVLGISDGRTGSDKRKDVEIYLEIPKEKQFESAEIIIDAGVVTVGDKLVANTIIMEADAGEITAEELEAENFQAVVGAGVIEIDDSQFNNVGLECGAGTVDFEAKITGDAQVSCGVGVVEMNLKNDADDVNYELTCGLGVIEIDGESFSSLSGGRRLERGGTRTFTLDCGLGTITLVTHD